MSCSKNLESNNSIILFCFLLTRRDTTPGNGKTSVVIRDAIGLTRSNRIDLEALKSLQQVQRKDLSKDSLRRERRGQLIILFPSSSSRSLKWVVKKWFLFCCIFAAQLAGI